MMYASAATVPILSVHKQAQKKILCMTNLAVMGLLREAGLCESWDTAEPVDPTEPREPELPAEVLLLRFVTLFLWLAGFTVTIRLWLFATIMSVT